jgi:hypothetical protein
MLCQQFRHKNILYEREELIKSGDDEFVDWAQVKRKI